MGGMSLSLNLSGLKSEPQEEVVERELIVIGGGPAGLTAGLYAGRAQLSPLIIVGPVSYTHLDVYKRQQ